MKLPPTKKRVLKTIEKPKLRLPQMLCDGPLHPDIANSELEMLRLLGGGSHLLMVMGRPKSGKSTLLGGLHNTPPNRGGLYQVWEHVHLIMPDTSRASIQDSIFNTLPDEKLHDELTPDLLMDIREDIERNRLNKLVLTRRRKKKKINEKTCIIFDDVQSQMKGPCENTLKRMAMNRRHLRLCMQMAIQSYKEVPLKIRKSATDFIIFDISPEDVEAIRRECMHITAEDMQDIVEKWLEVKKTNPRAFLYFNTATNKVFIDWQPYEPSYSTSDSDSD